MRLALVATVLTLALAGSASGVEQQLFVYGDSFAIGTETFLTLELPGWQIETDAAPNRHTREVPAALRAKGAELAPFIHLSVGTVDDPARPQRFRRRVRKIMRIVGQDRCVVWANIARPSIRRSGQGYNGWRPLNEVLRDEARRRPNLIVLRWTRLVRANSEWISGDDGTHVNQDGYRARADLVADGVRKCQERL